MSKEFFKRNTHNRGNGRELYFTQTETIEKIVKDLILYDNTLKDRVWIDVCAADGRWGEIISSKGIKCVSYDIEPLSDNVLQQDFFTMGKKENVFIFGNPPFSLLKRFVLKALTITDMCYFLGGSQIITGQLSKKVKMLHRFVGYEGKQKDNRSKLIFKDTLNKDVLIWCCGGLFANRLYPNLLQQDYFGDNTFRVLIQNYCLMDHRVRKINKEQK